MKIETRHVIIFIALLCLFYAIGVIDSNNVSNPIKQSQVDNKVQTHAVSSSTVNFSLSEMKEGFLTGCVISPKLDTFCNCCWDYLVDNYGKEGVIDMVANYINSGGNMTPRLQKAYNSCLKK